MKFSIPRSILGQSFHLSVLLLLISIHTACQKKGNDEDIIKLDISKIDSALIKTSVLDSVTYIFLETRPQCMLEKMDKIISKNNKYYILDKFNLRAITVFSNSGKFLYRIAALGRDAGQYIEPLDMDVDNEGNVFVYDNSRKCLIKYSDGGKFLKEYKLDFRFRNFGLVSDEAIVLQKVDINGEIAYSKAIYNFEDESFDETIRGDEVFDSNYLPNYSLCDIYNSAGTKYFYRRFSTDFYKVVDGRFSVFLRINPDILPDKDDLRRMLMNPQAFASTDKFLKDVNDIYQNKQYTILTIQKNPVKPIYAIISNATKKAIFFDSFNYPKFIGQDGFKGMTEQGNFFTTFSPSLLDAEVRRYVSTAGLPESQAETLLSLSAKSNPVIIEFRLKKNLGI